MKKLTFPSDGSGAIFNLGELLGLIPPNEWVWTVFEFQGVGTAPAGLDMPNFERCLWELDKGWAFSWSELLSFAEGIEQAFWCFIVAAESLENVRRPVEVDEAPEGCIIGLEAFDGSEWIIWSDEQALLDLFAPLSNSLLERQS